MHVFEAESTNTLANIPLSINKDPNLLNERRYDRTVSTDFHTQRIVTLFVFLRCMRHLEEIWEHSQSLENVQTYKTGTIKSYEKILDHMGDLQTMKTYKSEQVKNNIGLRL